MLSLPSIQRVSGRPAGPDGGTTAAKRTMPTDDMHETRMHCALLPQSVQAQRRQASCFAAGGASVSEEIRQRCVAAARRWRSTTRLLCALSLCNRRREFNDVWRHGFNGMWISSEPCRGGVLDHMCGVRRTGRARLCCARPAARTPAPARTATRPPRPHPRPRRVLRLFWHEASGFQGQEATLLSCGHCFPARPVAGPGSRSSREAVLRRQAFR